MLELKNIQKSYGEKTVIPGLDLSLAMGEISFICGTSGAGKSTVLQLIGLLDFPTGGEISVDGTVISGLSEEERCRYRAENIAFLFQDNNLIGGLTLRQNIQTALALSHKEKGEEEIMRVLAAFGIEKVYGQAVETLSGGERQRACIAIAFLKDAKIILADEPTGNLDHENALKVLSELSRVKGDRYVVVISHDLDLAENFADRIVTLSDGKIISDKKAAGGGERKDDPEANGGAAVKEGAFAGKAAPEDGAEKESPATPGNAVFVAEKGAAEKCASEAQEKSALAECAFMADGTSSQKKDGAVAEKESSEDGNAKKREKHFDFKTMFSYGSQKLKKRLKSFIIILITTALAFGSVLATMNLYTTTANVNRYVNEDYFNTDLIPISRKDFADEVAEEEETRRLKEIAGLKDSDVKEMIPTYSLLGCYMYLSNGDDAEKIEDYQQIVSDGFFRTRLASYKIDGAFPENEREIIVGQTLAETLRFSVGDTGYILVMGQPIEVKIAGINRTKSYGGKYKTFLANSLMKEIVTTAHSNQSTVKAELSLAGGGDSTRTSPFQMIKTEDEDRLLYGREPSAPGEIVLSSGDAYRAIYAFTSDRPAIEEIRGGTLSKETQKELFVEGKFMLSPAIGLAKRRTVTVVGISFFGSYMTDEFLQELTEAIPSSYSLYLKDYMKWEEVKAALEKEGIRSYPVAEDFESDMIGSVRIVLYFVMLLCFILCLLSVLLIHSYVKISVTERMYEIGVLKTWGAGKREIRKVLSFDFILLGVCSAILAVLVGVGIQNLFPLFVKDLPVSVKLGGWNFFLVAAFDFVVVLCASLSSSGRAGKIPPAALIRERM